MIRSLIVPLLILLFLFAGCASKQTIVQRDDLAYLQLSGDCEGVSLQIDDNAPLQVVGPCEDSRFSVAPGRHTVKLFRDNTLILERLMLFSASQTSEVTLP